MTTDLPPVSLRVHRREGNPGDGGYRVSRPTKGPEGPLVESVRIAEQGRPERPHHFGRVVPGLESGAVVLDTTDPSTAMADYLTVGHVLNKKKRKPSWASSRSLG